MSAGLKKTQGQLQLDLMDTGRYLRVNEVALDRTLWRSRFGRSYGPVLTLRLLMSYILYMELLVKPEMLTSYIYIYIWTYVWQR